MKKFFFLLSCILTCYINCYSQNRDEKKNKFFIAPGYGFAGSFFVRSYEEFAPLPDYKAFYKKHFIGSSQNMAFGLTIKNVWEIKAGINYQHFTRKVNARDVLNGVQIIFNHDIHHRDYMWYAAADRKINSKNDLFLFGLGAYYLVSKTQSIEIYTQNVISNEQVWKGSYNGELGLFGEFGYEYKFQPKVNLGIKSQFYFTATAGYAESVTLFPYIKILF